MTSKSFISQTPPQQEISEMGLFESGFNCVIQMPTGSGKTWLAERDILRTVESGYRAVYICPTKALADELYERWKKTFSGFGVGIFTGDYGAASRKYPESFETAQVMLLTSEKLDVCLRNWRTHWKWIPNVDLLVIDEFHLLGDGGRGARLEGTISRFRRLNPFARIVGLSATLGNRQELADWLNGVEYSSTWRPVEIKWSHKTYRKADEKPEMLFDVTTECVVSGGKSLVFVQSRRRAESLCKFLTEKGLKAAHHHAGLDAVERARVEAGLRKGEIDVIVSTATLEMGLNLPVRQVVLYDLQRFDGRDFTPLSTNSVWQRIGRAGRPGFDPIGEAVLLVPTWDRDSPRTYETGAFEPITSQLADRRFLAEQIIAEIGSGFSRTDAQVTDAFSRSLACQQRAVPRIDLMLSTLRKTGLITDKRTEASNGRIRSTLVATRLGRVVVRHLVYPETVQLMRSILQSDCELTFLDLLVTVCASIDCEPVITVDFEELDKISDLISTEPSGLLHFTSNDLLDLLRIRPRRFLSALKMAMMLRSWTRTGSTEEVAEEFDCYTFEVSRLADSATRLLTVMKEVLATLQDEEKNEETAFKTKLDGLLAMVSAGLNETAVTLTFVDGIGPKTARKLMTHGIEDIEDLASTDPEALRCVGGIGPDRANRWIAEASSMIKESSAFAFREFGKGSASARLPWDNEVEPYRLRRALELKVTGFEARTFRVVGGLEPHLVTASNGQFRCDCPDNANGNQCKHILAIRLHRRDRKIVELAKLISNNRAGDSINLYSLWLR